MAVENQTVAPGTQGVDQDSSQEPSEADKKLANMVNSAVTSQLKRALPKHLEEALTPHMSKFEQMLSSFKPAEASKPQAQASSSQQASGTDPEVLKQLEDMKSQLRREQDTRAKERQQARQDKAFSEVRGELTGKVRPEALDHVMKVLAHDGLVQVDTAGTVSLKIGEDALPIREGLSEYLKRKENSIFLPAPGYGQPVKKAIGQNQRQAPQRTQAGRSNGQPQEREDPLQKTLRDLNLGG